MNAKPPLPTLNSYLHELHFSTSFYFICLHPFSSGHFLRDESVKRKNILMVEGLYKMGAALALKKKTEREREHYKYQ